MAKKILFIGGTPNQSTMVHRIAEELPMHECWFTPFYAGKFLQAAANLGLTESTILGKSQRKIATAYFEKNNLLLDDGGNKNQYDLVVTTNDTLIPHNIRSKKIILVQEGMMTPENFVHHLVKTLRLPRYFGNTSMTGLSHAYQKFCVASDGFKEIYLKKGIPAHKIAVTGIPNFDDLDKYRTNDFPHQDYVLGATSCLRETGQFEDRRGFIFKSLDIAGGRQLIFKLHPRENTERATAEIRRHAPDALIFESGNTNHMIANCNSMVTKYSSVLMTALGLGKKVYSDLEPDLVKSLTPVQNGGRSAERIATICKEYL
ncbi:MAG: hypothetical protein GC192_19130 [Bacteroidetes bacterium]|nr:hypothetical protein [Bacteroidota bacterium]